MSRAPEFGPDHWSRRWVVAAAVLLILIVSGLVLADLLGGSRTAWVALLATVPALAATAGGPRSVLCAGLFAGALGVALGLHHDVPGRILSMTLASLAVVTLACGVTTVLGGRRERDGPERCVVAIP